MKWLSAFCVACGCMALACGDDGETGPSTTASGGAGGTTATGTASGGSAAGAPGPDPQYLPSPTGACPEFVDGVVRFAPAGIAERDVLLFISEEAQTQDGPLIFYWHGAGSTPLEANYGLGPVLADVTAQGGIVAAPYHDPAAGSYPWFLTTGAGEEDDLVLADEILACAVEQVGVDLQRIHSIGMSAGGLHTAQMSYRRSGYLASVVTYSGGLIGDPPQQETDNMFPAMIVHGGVTDVRTIVSFKDISEGYRDDLQDKGHFAFICDHGEGHTIPMDIREPAGQFFADHPFGTDPSPYADGLPESFPSYCSL